MMVGKYRFKQRSYQVSGGFDYAFKGLTDPCGSALKAIIKT
jgi:hypothetical protein